MGYSHFSGPVASANGFESGTSTDPILITTAGKLSQSYASSSATGGDTRMDYKKLTFTAAGSGETLRAWTLVTAANAAPGGTINGAHITMEVDGSGTLTTGAGNAIRATLGGNSTAPGGTLACIQLDSDFATGGSWGINVSFLRFTNSGTGSIAYMMNVPATTSGGIFAPHTTQVMTDSIRIIDSAGAVRYIMCTTASSNRTGGA